MRVNDCLFKPGGPGETLKKMNHPGLVRAIWKGGLRKFFQEKFSQAPFPKHTAGKQKKAPDTPLRPHILAAFPPWGGFAGAGRPAPAQRYNLQQKIYFSFTRQNFSRAQLLLQHHDLQLTQQISRGHRRGERYRVGHIHIVRSPRGNRTHLGPQPWADSTSRPRHRCRGWQGLRALMRCEQSKRRASRAGGT